MSVFWSWYGEIGRAARWGLERVRMRKREGVTQMPVPGKAPFLLRTTTPWSREM